MKVVVSGASGLVGTALVKDLKEAGHEVFTLVRKISSNKNNITWDPAKSDIDSDALEGMDAFVHLSGENIAAGRWTKQLKERIWNSRVDTTRLLVDTIKKLKNPPKTFICASAMGIYGNRGDTVLTEEMGGDDSFLSKLCQAWEAEALNAESLGIRVIPVRISLVVAKEGGALQSMLLPFKMGAGGKIGNGKQYMSWIMLQDLVSLITFALTEDSLKGPVNAATPNPVTNAEWTKTLGKVLHRPTILPLPATAVRTLMGEMGEALLLCSARLSSKKIESAGFAFQYPNLESALQQALSQ